MNKFLKKGKLLIILAGIVFVSIGVYAESVIRAEQIVYQNRTLKDAMDELYGNATNLKKICKLVNGNLGEIGSKYECDPGDGIKRNFYLLTLRSKEVDLIMDRNITQGSTKTTMTWYDAMKYFESEEGITKTGGWTDVLNIDLPKAQAIANAVGNNNWRAAENSKAWCLETKVLDVTKTPFCYNKTTDTLWLWDYTRDCLNWNCKNSLDSSEAYGYFTRDLMATDNYAWIVSRYGILDGNGTVSGAQQGIRPVITVLHTNLYK